MQAILFYDFSGSKATIILTLFSKTNEKMKQEDVATLKVV